MLLREFAGGRAYIERIDCGPADILSSADVDGFNPSPLPPTPGGNIRYANGFNPPIQRDQAHGVFFIDHAPCLSTVVDGVNTKSDKSRKNAIWPVFRHSWRNHRP
jgi:hypothetical protein